MKAILGSFLIIFFSFFNCNNLKKNNIEQYFVVVNYSLPFELYVNDVLVNSDLKNGLQGADNISLFFNRNTKQVLKIKLFADLGNNLTMISPISLQKQETSIFFVDSYGQHKKIMDLILPSIEYDLPYYEYYWEFDFKGNQLINDLEESVDLSSIDKEILQNEVLVKYEKLRTILNNGDGDKMIKEMYKAIQMVFISETLSEEEQQEYIVNLSDYFSSHKGTLPYLDTCTLHLMGNGKAIALEYKTSELEGMGILSSIDKINKFSNSNYIILHKPKSSGVFEVFRYSCHFTSL